MSYLISDRGVRASRGVGLGRHYQSAHYHRKKVYDIGPCTDQSITSFFSLDEHVATHGLGPLGDEVPEAVWLIGPGSGAVECNRFSDLIPSVCHPSYGMARPVGHLILITTDPPAGSTYHMRKPTAKGSVSIHMCTAVACGPIDDPPGAGTHLQYTSIVNSGTIVGMSFDAKCDVLTGTPQVEMAHDFYEQDGTYITTLFDFFNLTTGYVTYQSTVVAPANSYFWLTRPGWFGGSTDPVWDISNFGISVV